MADRYDDYDEEQDDEPKPPPRPRKPRKPIDWPLVVMLVGTVVFLLIFGAITLLAPRRPFLALRIGQGVGGKPAATSPANPPASGAVAPTPTAAATTPVAPPPKP